MKRGLSKASGTDTPGKRCATREDECGQTGIHHSPREYREDLTSRPEPSGREGPQF